MNLFEFATRTDVPDDIPADVARLFEDLALKVAKTGRNRFSADAILHQIRWEYQVERGNSEFKINDHFSAPLARWFLARHPDLAKQKFFETRVRRCEAV